MSWAWKSYITPKPEFLTTSGLITELIFLLFRIRIIMKTSTLSVICVFMTLAMALSVYGMGGYGYYVPSYGAQQGSNPLGIGQGGLCKLSIQVIRASSYYSFHFLLGFPPSSDRNVSYLSSKMNKIFAFILRYEFETWIRLYELQ